MTGSLDLDAYCRRIHWTGDTSPTVETLAGLLAAHTARIPFENLDVLLRRPLRLDPGSLQDKLVHARRGGYCFEHATLFAAVLEALGFRPVRHAARVVLFAPHTEVPRSHMFLTVPVDGATFVVDPGFGAFTAGFPVPLVDAETARREPATHWMGRHGDLWALHVPRDGEIWIYTYAKSQKVRNLERDPRATLVLETGHEYGELRGIEIEAEVGGNVDLVLFVLSSLGLNDYRVRIGIRDPESDKYVGDPADWDRAEATLIELTKSRGMNYTVLLGGDAESSACPVKKQFQVRALPTVFLLDDQGTILYQAEGLDQQHARRQENIIRQHLGFRDR